VECMRAKTVEQLARACNESSKLLSNSLTMPMSSTASFFLLLWIMNLGTAFGAGLYGDAASELVPEFARERARYQQRPHAGNRSGASVLGHGHDRPAHAGHARQFILCLPLLRPDSRLVAGRRAARLAGAPPDLHFFHPGCVEAHARRNTGDACCS
jgi:hypothetical protein